nr:fungal specific transcription factor [Colletotrichum truncatum]KAF6784676.1 fungal specific transcription factor [Colletotrichum truncatum]
MLGASRRINGVGSAGAEADPELLPIVTTTAILLFSSKIATQPHFPWISYCFRVIYHFLFKLGTRITALMESPNLARRDRSHACGPCYRRKVACDRAGPVCGSCSRRRKPRDTCEYDSVARLSSTSRLRRREKSAPSLNSDSSTSIEPRPCRSFHLPDSLLRQYDSHSDPIDSSDTPSCGYLGFTSFLAIYEETCDALSPHQPQLDFGSSKRDQPVKDSEPKTPNLSDASLQAGLDVLQCIPRRQEAVALLDYHFNAYDAWIHPLARLMLDSLYDTFGHIFEPPECSKDLLTGLALVLGKNTSKVFCEDEPDSRRWISQFVGANIRWETLGVLFTYWEFGARSINTRSGTSDIQKTSLKPAAVFRKSIESCLSLARAGTKTGNTMLVYIYYKRGIIDSVISGDASLSYWQNHAETVAILSFLGLHIATLSPEQPYKPTLSSEIRRRIFCHVFISDKGASSFTGRPPLLSGKYTSTPLPLDLRGEYLLSDEAMLAREVATLDEQGWSKSNNVNSISSLRARFCFSVICDEIFEIALAVRKVTPQQTILDLKTRQIEIHSRLPLRLHFDLEDIRDPTYIPRPCT